MSSNRRLCVDIVLIVLKQKNIIYSSVSKQSKLYYVDMATIIFKRRLFVDYGNDCLQTEDYNM